MADVFRFRSIRGIHHGSRYELEAFRRRYDLEIEQARDLYERFGPSSVELDLLMSAKKQRGRPERFTPTR